MYYTTGIGQAAGTIVSGTTTVTTSGTAVRITATSTPIAGVWVGGDIGNAGVVLVGDVNVSATGGTQQGMIIGPAESSKFLAINDLNKLWVDADEDGDKIVWLYLQP